MKRERNSAAIRAYAAPKRLRPRDHLEVPLRGRRDRIRAIFPEDVIPGLRNIACRFVARPGTQAERESRICIDFAIGLSPTYDAVYSALIVRSPPRPCLSMWALKSATFFRFDL